MTAGTAGAVVTTAALGVEVKLVVIVVTGLPDAPVVSTTGVVVTGTRTGTGVLVVVVTAGVAVRGLLLLPLLEAVLMDDACDGFNDDEDDDCGVDEDDDSGGGRMGPAPVPVTLVTGVLDSVVAAGSSFAGRA